MQKTVSLCSLDVIDGTVSVLDTGVEPASGVAQVNTLNRKSKDDVQYVAFLVSEYGPGYGAWRTLIERQRQIRDEGYTAEHDAEHANGELVQAAIAYACIHTPDPEVAAVWPWEMESFKLATPERDLERAAALLTAEIDRRVAESLGSGK